MAAEVFQLLNGGIRYGKDLKTSATGVKPGLLVKLDSSGSTVSTSGSTAATKPFGIAFGNRYGAWRPTSKEFALNEPLVAVWGVGMALLSVDFFDPATLPTAGVKLYATLSGKWTPNVTANQVGDCIGTRTRTEPVGGVGVSQNLSLVRFNIQP